MHDDQQMIHAFVQAGGRSSRMGRDKSWVEVAGRPMIESVLSTVGDLAVRTSIIINSGNPLAERYRRTAAERGAALLFDLHDHRGPLGGIDTALRNCRAGETALIVACDLPRLSPEFLRLLAEIHFAERNDLTAPADAEGRIQMLAGFYSAACLKPVERMLKADILKVDRLCREVRCRRVEFAEYRHLPDAAYLLENVNSI